MVPAGDPGARPSRRDHQLIFRFGRGAVFYWRLVASEPVDHAAVQALVARVLPTRETFAQQPAG
jgi:hypothetical protein